MDDFLEEPRKSVIKKPTDFYTSDGRKIVMPQKHRQHKRTLAEQERDRVDIAALYLRGYSFMEIAVELSKNRSYTLATSQISTEIQKIWATWRESYIKDFHELKVRELAKIDKLEAQYWDAWERSCEPTSSVEKFKVEDMTGHRSGEDTVMSPSYSRTKTVAKKIDSTGNPKFLEGIERCIDKRCQILGLYAAKNVNINWRQQAEEAGVNPEQVVDDIVGQFLTAASMGRGSGSRSLGEGSEDFE